uniref:Beta-carotene isomerase D27-like C-terminal domain-containing protein n=1 Tax=Aegilops tauschii TaxID=37682 RepID=N1R325_AEGTA
MATPTTSRLHHYLLPALPSRPPRTSSSSAPSVQGPSRRPTSRLYCSSPPVGAPPSGKGGEYRPSLADDFLLAFFRAKMVEEVGWDSQKPGYEGLIEVANRLMIKGKSASETEQSAVRVLQALFPPLLLVLFKALLAPIANGQLASMMVFVEKCKYLEESKCLGICINTCKLPTQTFFKDHMGVDLYMEPNFEDYSCQFNFGVPPPPIDTDKALKEPCLDICTNARRRRELGSSGGPDGLCPQV